MVRNDQFAPVGALAQAMAKAVNKAMARSGLSGNQLAKKMGRSQSYVSARTQGRASWTLDEVDQIAQLVGVSFFDIIDAAQDM